MSYRSPATRHETNARAIEPPASMADKPHERDPTQRHTPSSAGPRATGEGRVGGGAVVRPCLEPFASGRDCVESKQVEQEG